jgi:hypothetical protein
MFTTTTASATTGSVLLLLLAVGARAQSDSPQFPQWSDRWTLVFRHFSSIDGDAVYCECTRCFARQRVAGAERRLSMLVLVLHACARVVKAHASVDNGSRGACCCVDMLVCCCGAALLSMQPPCGSMQCCDCLGTLTHSLLAEPSPTSPFTIEHLSERAPPSWCERVHECTCASM